MSPGLSVYRAIQLPARTAKPTAILTHIARSALGEMSLIGKETVQAATQDFREGRRTGRLENRRRS